MGLVGSSSQQVQARGVSIPAELVFPPPRVELAEQLQMRHLSEVDALPEQLQQLHLWKLHASQPD